MPVFTVCFYSVNVKFGFCVIVPSVLYILIKNTTITMFPQSSQRKYWIFSDENDLTALREKTNAEFIQRHGANMKVSYAACSDK